MLTKNVSDWKNLETKIDLVVQKIDKNLPVLDKIDELSKKIDRNQSSLDKIEDISRKIDRNQSSLDKIEDVSRILAENEQNLKDLGSLKHRLDTLDKILVSVDKIAGEVTSYREQQELNSSKLTDHDDRIEKVEKHLNLPISP